MGCLSIYHPDILEFLESKSWDEGKLTHFNLSVLIDDKFMRAVENDEIIQLHYSSFLTSSNKIFAFAKAFYFLKSFFISLRSNINLSTASQINTQPIISNIVIQT